MAELREADGGAIDEWICYPTPFRLTSLCISQVGDGESVGREVGFDMSFHISIYLPQS